MKIQRFEDIEAWKEARDIVNRVYRGYSVIELKKDYRESPANAFKPDKIP